MVQLTTVALDLPESKTQKKFKISLSRFWLEVIEVSVYKLYSDYDRQNRDKSPYLVKVFEIDPTSQPFLCKIQ